MTASMELTEYTEAKKRVVRKMLEGELTLPQIADRFGVARQTMWQFIRKHELDKGLNPNAKNAEEYYVNRRYGPRMADPSEVKELRTLGREFGVEV